MSSTVTLERATSGAMELRRDRFEIVLDGNPAGSIDRNQTVELPVEPGPHTLQVRTGRYSSHAAPLRRCGRDEHPVPLQRSDPLAPLHRVTPRAHDRPQAQTRIGDRSSVRSAGRVMAELRVSLKEARSGSSSGHQRQWGMTTLREASPCRCRSDQKHAYQRATKARDPVLTNRCWMLLLAHDGHAPPASAKD